MAKKTSEPSKLTFLTDYWNLQGFPISIRVDHGSCFLSNEFKNFCVKKKFILILCRVEDRRSNGVVECTIHTVKAKLIALSFNEANPTLTAAIDKNIWNLCSTKQASIGKYTPLETFFIDRLNPSGKL